jgi:amidase
LRSFLNAEGKHDLWQDPVRLAQVKPETQWEIATGRQVTAAQIHAASRIRSAWYARAAEVFGQVDLLALPSAQVWPFPAEWRWPERIGDREMDSYHRWMEVVVPASLAGLPALSVPVGFSDAGLPMGMQLIGRSGNDSGVLAAGHAWHRATDWPGRRPPSIAGVAAAE